MERPCIRKLRIAASRSFASFAWFGNQSKGSNPPISSGSQQPSPNEKLLQAHSALACSGATLKKERGPPALPAWSKSMKGPLNGFGVNNNRIPSISRADICACSTELLKEVVRNLSMFFGRFQGLTVLRANSDFAPMLLGRKLPDNLAHGSRVLGCFCLGSQGKFLMKQLAALISFSSVSSLELGLRAISMEMMMS